MITPEQLAKSGSEHGHQAALFLWAALNKDQYPQLKWLFAVPNGFFANSGQKAKMKAEGLKDGVPDVWLPFIMPHKVHSVITGICCGLVIEMKVKKNKTSEDQDKWIEHLSKHYWKCCVCYSWEEARDRILEYING